MNIPDHQQEGEQLELVFDPEASEDDIDRFVYSLALAIAATARKIVEEERARDGDLPAIEY